MRTRSRLEADRGRVGDGHFWGGVAYLLLRQKEAVAVAEACLPDREITLPMYVKNMRFIAPEKSGGNTGEISRPGAFAARGRNGEEYRLHLRAPTTETCVR